MSDNGIVDTEAAQPVEPVEPVNPVEPVDSVEPVEPDADEHHQDDDTRAAQNAEAAKYRRRLRETQKELETVTAQLDALQRQQVETMLAKSGVKPDAVFAVTELSGLLGDDGGIDADKLNAAVVTATERFGIVKAPKGSHVPGIGNQPSALPSGDRWSDAFAPKRH